MAGTCRTALAPSFLPPHASLRKSSRSEEQRRENTLPRTTALGEILHGALPRASHVLWAEAPRVFASGYLFCLGNRLGKWRPCLHRGAVLTVHFKRFGFAQLRIHTRRANPPPAPHPAGLLWATLRDLGPARRTNVNLKLMLLAVPWAIKDLCLCSGVSVSSADTQENSGRLTCSLADRAKPQTPSQFLTTTLSNLFNTHRVFTLYKVYSKRETNTNSLNLHHRAVRQALWLWFPFYGGG